MYLMPANSGAVNNRKWNLGRMGMQPVRLHGFRGIGCPCQKKLGQLGQTAGVPAGTVLAYTGTWKDSKLQVNNPDAVQAQIQSNLAQQYGIVIDNQVHSQSDYINFSGTQSMTLQVHTTSDYGAAADIQSVIDGAIYAVTNKQVSQGMPASTIRIVQAVSPAASVSLTAQLPASTSAALAAAQAGLSDAIARGDTVSAAQFQQQIANIQGTRGDPLSWITNNWPWLVGGGIALVAAKELL
jgi:hypothetical protein